MRRVTQWLVSVTCPRRVRSGLAASQQVPAVPPRPEPFQLPPDARPVCSSSRRIPTMKRWAPGLIQRVREQGGTVSGAAHERRRLSRKAWR